VKRNVRSTDERHPPLGPGLRLFDAGESDGHRRRRRIFLAVWGAVTLGLTVPLVPAVWGSRSVLLGLPASLVWVSACLAMIFTALVWLYRGEEE